MGLPNHKGWTGGTVPVRCPAVSSSTPKQLHPPPLSKTLNRQPPTISRSINHPSPIKHQAPTIDHQPSVFYSITYVSMRGCSEREGKSGLREWHSPRIRRHDDPKFRYVSHNVTSPSQRPIPVALQSLARVALCRVWEAAPTDGPVGPTGGPTKPQGVGEAGLFPCVAPPSLHPPQSNSTSPLYNPQPPTINH